MRKKPIWKENYTKNRKGDMEGNSLVKRLYSKRRLNREEIILEGTIKREKIKKKRLEKR